MPLSMARVPAVLEPTRFITSPVAIVTGDYFLPRPNTSNCARSTRWYAKPL